MQHATKNDNDPMAGTTSLNIKHHEGGDMIHLPVQRLAVTEEAISWTIIWKGAAHTTLAAPASTGRPHMGQGASLAMEDALVLAKCLRDILDSAGAFTHYEQLRKDRVEPMVRAAWRIGNQNAPTNALTRGIRDAVLPFFLTLRIKQAQQAYAYRVDWSAPAA